MAKRFAFRLEPLLTVRRAYEAEQQRVVAENVRQVQQCIAELANLRGKLSETVGEARRARRRQQMDIGTELQEQRWRAHLKRRIVSQEEEVKTREQSLAEARGELARRSMEVKAIEKLRERRLDEHRREVQREERIESDELATQMFIRRGRGAEVQRIAG